MACNNLHKEGTIAIEAFKSLSTHYGHSAPDRSTISKWIDRFAAGRVSLEDDPRSGAPVKAITDNNVEVVRQLLNEDRRLIFDELQVSIHKILLSHAVQHNPRCPAHE